MLFLESKINITHKILIFKWCLTSDSGMLSVCRVTSFRKEVSALDRIWCWLGVRAWGRNWLCWLGDCFLSLKSFGGDLYWTRRTFEAAESGAVSQGCFWLILEVLKARHNTRPSCPLLSWARVGQARQVVPCTRISPLCRVPCPPGVFPEYLPGLTSRREAS